MAEDHSMLWPQPQERCGRRAGVLAAEIDLPEYSDEIVCGVQTRSMDQKRQWCQAVKKLIIENFHKSIPDRAKQVVLGAAGDDEKCRLRAGVFT